MQKKQEAFKAALANSEKIIENANTLIMAGDEKGNLTIFNRAYEKLTGYKKQDVLGRPFTFLMPKDEQKKHLNTFQKVFLKKHVKNYEITILTKKGEKRLTLFNSALIKDRYGKPMVVGMGYDITERKKEEEELLRLSYAMKISKEGILIADINGDILDANETAMRKWGIKNKGELIGKNALGFVVEEDRKRLSEVMKDLVSKGYIENIEYKIIDKHGNKVLLGANAVLIKDIKNRPSGFVVTARDITKLKQEEANLKNSEERFKILFEYAPDAYYLSDLEGTFIDGNKAAEKITGYNKKELIGKSFLKLKLLPLMQIPKAAKLLAKNALGQPTGPDEFTIRAKDGSQLYVEISTYPVSIRGKTLVLGIARDITERKKSEEALIESEKKLSSIFEAAGDGIVYLDTSGKIISANKKSEEMLGYSYSEVIGKDFTEMKAIDPSYIPLFLKIMKDAISTGKTIKNLEIELTKKDGKKIYTEVSASAVKKQGVIKGLSVVIRDITDRKKAEEQITEYEEELSSIFEAAGDGIVYLDISGKINTINKKIEEMTGYKLNEIIGKSFTDFGVIGPNKLQEILKLISDTITSKNTIKNLELELIKKDGSRIPVEVNTEIVKKEEKAIGFVVLIRDITERKKAEEALKKSRDELAKAYNELKSLDRMKDEFVNISGHELKTPLVPIISYIDLILANKKSRLGEKEKEELAICLRNAIRLKDLVTDILDISKLETKVMKFEMRSNRIENIINTVVQNLKPAAEKKHLDLIINLKPKLPHVNIDSERIGQALSKLVENSIKFTDRGGITISAEKQKNKILVRVLDTGIGISQEDMPKLFTKFYQADTSPTRKAQGTGLGLFICKEIIEAHNGRIWAESHGLGKGTAFSFTIPFNKPKQPLIKKHHIEKAKKIIRSLYFEPKQ